MLMASNLSDIVIGIAWMRYMVTKRAFKYLTAAAVLLGPDATFSTEMAIRNVNRIVLEKPCG